MAPYAVILFVADRALAAVIGRLDTMCPPPPRHVVTVWFFIPMAGDAEGLFIVTQHAKLFIELVCQTVTRCPFGRVSVVDILTVPGYRRLVFIDLLVAKLTRNGLLAPQFVTFHADIHLRIDCGSEGRALLDARMAALT